ncbi:efflux RND transporter periplasmic adaptor subunit [candidate division KSB1 bacterium]|nr:efflux RND transporter periplasmic adaptor subunit [candidate division KSB1 bacterium]
MSKKKKLLLFSGGLVLIIVFIVANLFKSKGGHIEVQVEEVKKGSITQTVSGSGKIRPEVEVKISANVSAEIIGLYVEEGDKVKKGDLLVELDAKRYEAALERAKSNLKSARANLKKAKSDYKRTLDLYTKKLISDAEKESAEATLLLAESEVEQAQASLEETEDQLQKTKIYSPMTGTVSQLNKELGEIALGSTFQADVIMVVADLSNMEVVAEIDENDVVLVSIGDSTNIEVDAIPDTTFSGIVMEIAHTATTRGLGTQEEVTNFEVKIAVINPVDKLRPGMSATVDIATETRRNVLHVPIQAVTVRMPGEINAKKPGEAETDSESDKKETGETEQVDPEDTEDKMIEVVFIVKGENADIVPVETGISNDTDIEIKSGLEEGQKVVIGSYRAISKTLKDESLVKVTDKNKS